MEIIEIKDNKTFIRADRALIGDNFEPRRDILLTIEGCVITSLGNANEKISRNADTDKLPGEDNKGCYYHRLHSDITLMPAFIDAHVHLGLAKKCEPAGAHNSTDILQQYRVLDDISAFLKNGIFAVRDGGDAFGFNQALNEALKHRKIKTPVLITTGKAIRKNKGYGSFLGPGFTEKKELVGQLEALARAGVAQLKVIVSGIVSFREYGKVGLAPVNFEELSFIVNFAHEKKIKVMAHANSASAVEMAIEAGVDSIEHGYFLEDDSLKKMAEKEIVWLPTIIPVFNQSKKPFDFDKSAKELAVIKKIYERQLEKLYTAVREQVPVGLGTDSGASGVSHGVGYFQEIELYKKAGLTAKEILNAAISVNGSLLSLSGTAASIEIGKTPYLIGVKGDPLEDISNVENPEYFFGPAGIIANK